MDPEFWHSRWQANQTGFHSQETNPWLVRYWPALDTTPGDRVLVPLCGKSLDMLWLLQQGYRVTGIEISRIAVEAFFSENRLQPAVSEKHGFTYWRNSDLEILCGDFFTLQREAIDTIDAVYDRASLIALPPAMRPRYASRLTRLLDPGVPCLLITLDYNQMEMSGPPFAVSADEVSRLYADNFSIEQLCTTDVLADHAKFRDAGVRKLSECSYRMQRR